MSRRHIAERLLFDFPDVDSLDSGTGSCLKLVLVGLVQARGTATLKNYTLYAVTSAYDWGLKIIIVPWLEPGMGQCAPSSLQYHSATQ